LKILLSAGEVSGDAIGATLACALQAQVAHAELAGCAGDLMRGAGVRPLSDSVDFSHSGWASVASRLPILVWKAWRYLRVVDRFAPDLALLVDAPGLHGPLLGRLKRRGVPVAWVAPPQLWAWKNRRPAVLQGLHVYPSHAFEQEVLREAGALPHWWGYPGIRTPVVPSAQRDKLALFPGSRSAWRHRHTELFAQAAKLADLPLRTVFVHPAAVNGAGEAGSPSLRPSQVLPEAALALSLPGTATLETARWGIPTVVAARPGAFDLFVARRRLADGFRALPNRILSAEVFPEHYAEQANAEYLARELHRVWSHRERIAQSLAGLEERLGESDAPIRIARHFLETLGKL